MAKKIFINLPVSDLTRAITFYTSIGFENNPKFTNDEAAWMTLSEEIYVMLLTHPKFEAFTNKEIANTYKTASVINSISVDNKNEVEEIFEKAIIAGGKETSEAKDFGFMQQRSFEDLDGHLWEVFFLDFANLPQL